MSLPLFRLLSNEGKKYYNIIILKSYQADVSTKKKGTQRAQLYTFLQKDILLRRIYPQKSYSTRSVIYIFTERYVIEVTNSETQLCSNLVLCSNQGVTVHSAVTARNTGANPFSF